MITLIITALLAFGIFFVPFITDKKYGIMLIIFLMPMAQRSVELFGASLSFLSISVFSLVLGCVLSRKLAISDISKVEYGRHLLFILIAIGLSSLFLTAEGIPDTIKFLALNSFNASSNYITSLISAMLFYVILVTDMRSRSRIQLFILTFIASLYFMTFILFVNNIINIPLPNAMLPTSVVGEGYEADKVIQLSQDAADEAYFSGYIGFVENFAEYLFFIYALSFFILSSAKTGRLSKSTKLFCIGAILQVLYYMIPTANKTLPILLGLFTFIYFITIKGYRYKIMAICSVLVSYAAYTYLENMLASTFLMQRMALISERYYKMSAEVNFYSLTMLLGRTDMIPYFSEIIKTGGIFGIGPVVTWKIHGSDIAYHNLYYSLYLSFGFVGFIAFITLPFRIAFNLFRFVIQSTLEDRQVKILLILFIIVLIDQIKVSAMRIPFGIFAFAFLLALSVVITKFKALNTMKPILSQIKPARTTTSKLLDSCIYLK
jgi:hypothetical protein